MTALQIGANTRAGLYTVVKRNISPTAESWTMVVQLEWPSWPGCAIYKVFTVGHFLAILGVGLGNSYGTSYLCWQVTACEGECWHHPRSDQISSRCSGSHRTLQYCHAPSAVLPLDLSFHCYQDTLHLQYSGILWTFTWFCQGCVQTTIICGHVLFTSLKVTWYKLGACHFQLQSSLIANVYSHRARFPCAMQSTDRHY